MKATNFQALNAPNVHKAHEVDGHESLAEFDPFEALERSDPMEPKTPFPGADGILFDAEILYARRANGKNAELFRIETKFNFSIIAALSRKLIDGHLRTTCLCSDGSELICDISREAARTLEPTTNPEWEPRYTQVRFGDKVRNFGYLEQASEFAGKLDPELKPVIVDMNTGEVSEAGKRLQSDWLDDLVIKYHPDAICNENRTTSAVTALAPENIEEARCTICGRVLTNPLSVSLEIGPECRKNLHTHGEKHLADNILSDELIGASKLWKDEKFQKWVLKGCLTLGASLPAEVVCQEGGNQFWGVKSWPHIYYKDRHGILNVINYDSRKLKYRALDLRSFQNPLDQMVQRRIDELAENGGKEVRPISL